MKILVLKRSIYELLLLIFYWLMSRIQASSGWLNGFSSVSARSCSNSSDCGSPTSGEICFQLYEGCPRAQCMCHHHSRLVPSSGGGGGGDMEAKCVPMSLGLGPCSSDVMCRDGMTCRAESCRCISGKMTPDRLQCLHFSARLLGERCHSTENTCYQKSASGYTSGDVTCSSNGVCACAEGHRADELSCRRRKVYELGCKRSFHCEGGAVCVDGRCVCPIGYSAPRNPAAGFKCFRNGATTDVRLGSECDEINERSYCAADLVCHKCDSESAYHCVRFVLAKDFSPIGTSGSTRTSLPSSLTSSISVIISASLLLINTSLEAR